MFLAMVKASSPLVFLDMLSAGRAGVRLIRHTLSAVGTLKAKYHPSPKARNYFPGFNFWGEVPAGCPGVARMPFMLVYIQRAVYFAVAGVISTKAAFEKIITLIAGAFAHGQSLLFTVTVASSGDQLARKASGEA